MKKDNAKSAFKRVKGYATSFINAFLPNTENKSKNLWSYGADDQLPNRLIKLVSDSGVGTKAANKVATYIASDGFSDKVAAVYRVNKKQTADQLLFQQSPYMAILNGVAFHVKRKGNSVESVESIPFQCVRKKLTGGFIYNPTYGQDRFDRNKDRHYPEFVEGDLSDSQLFSKVYDNGEILYVFKTTILNSNYPVPDWYAQIEDVETSSELSRFDLETVVNGFVTSAMITMLGAIDDSTKDDKGKTELDYVVEEFKQFTGQDKNKKGLSGRNKAWLNFAETRDQAPLVQQFDTKSILEASNSKREVIERAVCRLFDVHPVLCNYSDASILGSTEAMANVSNELTKAVLPFQSLLSDAFKKMFPDLDWTISQYTPIKFIPDKILEDMTPDERRATIGLPPAVVDTPGANDKILQAVNSLSPLVANKVLESMTPDEIRSLVGLDKITPPPTA